MKKQPTGSAAPAPQPQGAENAPAPAGQAGSRHRPSGHPRLARHRTSTIGRYGPRRAVAWGLLGLLVVVVGALAIRLFVVAPFRIASNSMYPYVHTGDTVYIWLNRPPLTSAAGTSVCFACRYPKHRPAPLHGQTTRDPRTGRFTSSNASWDCPAIVSFMTPPRPVRPSARWPSMVSIPDRTGHWGKHRRRHWEGHREAGVADVGVNTGVVGHVPCHHVQDDLPKSATCPVTQQILYRQQTSPQDDLHTHLGDRPMSNASSPFRSGLQTTVQTNGLAPSQDTPRAAYSGTPVVTFHAVHTPPLYRRPAEPTKPARTPRNGSVNTAPGLASGDPGLGPEDRGEPDGTHEGRSVCRRRGPPRPRFHSW